MGKRARKAKHAKKVRLPRDRHGTPINVGDLIAWDDGTCARVETLTYLGDEFADTIGSWVCNIETDGFDNRDTSSPFVGLAMAEVEHHGASIGEQIVRCRDCKFCMAYMAGTYCDYMAHAIEPDGFCAWGERRDG